MKIILINTFIFMIVVTSFSQNTRDYTNNSNIWFSYVGTPKISQKWGLHLEIAWRRNDGVKNNMQAFPRIGVNYHFHAQAYATLGYAFVGTYPYGEFAVKATFPEHRAWQQLQFKNQVGKLECVNRFRLEQRWVYNPITHDSLGTTYKEVYSNRIRLLSRFSYPLGKVQIEDRTFYLTASDELFINFGKNVAYNILDQNRGFVGIGYKIPKMGRLEIGYLNQRLYKSDGIRVENNNTLMISFSSSFDFIKKNKS